MKHPLIPALLTLLSLSFPRLDAQTTLHDFSAFVQTDQTSFSGDWSDAGDPALPATTFVQNVGSFDFVSGTTSDQSGATFYFTSLADPIDLSGTTMLSFTARLLGGNTASSFVIALLNSDASSYASATFNTADFASATFVTVSSALTAFGGFNPAQVVAFQISGSMPGGTDLLNLSADNLAATASAVPEPATYAALMGAGVMALALWRRRRVAA